MQTTNEKKRQFWTGHIGNQSRGTDSAEAYCRANGLSPHTFGYWKKKFSSEKRHRTPSPQVKATPTGTTSFVPVKIKRADSPERTVDLPNAKWVAEFILALSHGGGL